jgi:ABC-2 type transport system ATP-binding protein
LGEGQGPALNTAGSSPALLQVSDLRKVYRGQAAPAVDGVSFSVSAGEVLGLLGPNGAGKSTTIGIVTTRIPVTSGEVLVGGASALADPAGVRAAIGVAGQSNTLDGSCTVFENLYLHCRYHGMGRRSARQRATDMMSAFQLSAKAEVKPDTLSGGQARRLQLARAMAHDPALLLLDEPTNELDASIQALFWEQINRLRSTGRTAILLATHILEEAEEHCDRVLILDAGRIVMEGRPNELRSEFRATRTIEMTVRKQPRLDSARLIEELDGVARCLIAGRTVSILVGSGEVPLEHLAQLLGPYGIEELTARKASLREIFLEAVDGQRRP